MTAATHRPALAVLGAINVDLVVSGAPLPRPGETVTGGTFAQHHGGKGGNQAVAAARALGWDGRPDAPAVWILGAVGDDRLGVEALEALRAERVLTEHVRVVPGTPTGTALIAVAADGENQISVAPGANDALDREGVLEALEALGPRALLASLEIPEAVALSALRWCRDADVPAIVNPAPFRPWARDLLPLAEVATPNAHELEAIGEPPPGPTIVVTRGSHGAAILGEAQETPVAAPRVRAVDTTGAGDCFNGVLAASLVEGYELPEAVRRAVVAAAVSTTEPGARGGMPTRDELEAALASA